MHTEEICKFFKIDEDMAVKAMLATISPFKAVDKTENAKRDLICNPSDLIMAAIIVCRGTVNAKLDVAFDAFSLDRAPTLRPSDVADMLSSFVRMTEAVSRQGILSALSPSEAQEWVTDAFCSAGKGSWGDDESGKKERTQVTGPKDGETLTLKEFKRWVKEFSRRKSHVGDVGCAVGLCLSQAVKMPKPGEKIPADPRRRHGVVRPFQPRKRHMEMTEADEENALKLFNAKMHKGTDEESQRRYERVQDLMAETSAHTDSHHAFETVRLQTYHMYHEFDPIHNALDRAEMAKMKDLAQRKLVCSQLDISEGAWFSNLRDAARCVMYFCIPQFCAPVLLVSFPKSQ
jgi:hypothetical protein